jgi:predicted TIM-barrel fold metal-dependent hydrolase
MPDAVGLAIDDLTVMAPLVEATASLGLILLFHSTEPVGHVYPGKGTVFPERLYSLIRAFPEARVILAHWGGGLPFYALMPEVREALRNVYVDTAASPLLYQTQIFRTVSDVFGADRILFGSDFPLISQRRALREVTTEGLPSAAEAAILGGNSCRLFGIDNGTAGD